MAEVEQVTIIDEEDTQRNKYLNFLINDEDYAIDISNVIEIVGIQDITEVPEMQNYVKGVINLRGQVIPVIDVRLRFGLQERDYDGRTCVVVVCIEDITAGLIVDLVKEVINIHESQISNTKNNKNGNEKGQFLKGLGNTEEGVVILLDVPKLLNIQTLELAEN